MLKDILIGLGTGLVSGILSGYLVYLFTKRREKKQETYQYCMQFLFSVLSKCEMCIPYKDLNYFSFVNKDKNSLWRTSIQKILDSTNPYGHEDKILSKEEKELADCVRTALNELENWKKQNHLN